MEYNSEKIEDFKRVKVFSRRYLLQNITLLKDGTISRNFNTQFEEEKEKFIDIMSYIDQKKQTEKEKQQSKKTYVQEPLFPNERRWSEIPFETKQAGIERIYNRGRK